MGFGTVDKIFLEYDQPWWDKNCDGIQFAWHANEPFILNCVDNKKQPKVRAFIISNTVLFFRCIYWSIYIVPTLCACRGVIYKPIISNGLQFMKILKNIFILIIMGMYVCIFYL